MDTELVDLLDSVRFFYEGDIDPSSRFYCVVQLDKMAELADEMGLARRVAGKGAIVPLATPLEHDISVEVDGKSLASYVLLDSGIVVEKSVAEMAGLPYVPYTPPDPVMLLQASP